MLIFNIYFLVNIDDERPEMLQNIKILYKTS